MANRHNPKLRFGNLSDPAQNAALLAKVQGNWGSAMYDEYGFYTTQRRGGGLGNVGVRH